MLQALFFTTATERRKVELGDALDLGEQIERRESLGIYLFLKAFVKRDVFVLIDKFLEPVKELIEKNEIEIRPEERKKEVLSMIAQDLGNLSISREKVSWGISLPFDKKQTVDV